MTGKKKSEIYAIGKEECFLSGQWKVGKSFAIS